MASLRVAGFCLVLVVGCSDTTSAPTNVSRGMPLVGGTPDTTTRGVVGLVVDQSSGCSGSLLAPNLVLTARHCVAPINNPDGTVMCGVTNFGTPFPPSAFIVTPDDNFRNGVPAGAQYSVDRVVTTPGSGVCGNDVSLLILGENVPVGTAPLLVPRIDIAVETNEGFDAVGYGITDPDDVQGVTFGQRMRVNGLSVRCVGTACASVGGSRTEWGAVTPVCGGDSGGPALDDAGQVIGVASRGNANCDSALYGAVSSWKSLIVDTAIDAATAGGYSPPSWTDAPDAGGPPDSGVPDSGMQPDSGAPDSGTPADAGGPDAGEPDSGGPEPDAGDAIGQPCNGACPGGLACYLPNEDDAGVCVPHCTEDANCPTHYRCSARLGVCVPPTLTDDDADSNKAAGDDDGGCGCRAATRPDGRPAHVLAFLMLAGLGARRRRHGRW